MKALVRLNIATAVAILTPYVVAQSFNDHHGHTATTITVTNLPTETSAQTGCPTVTATRELCTTCPVPMCLGLATVTQSCGCPTPIPTVYLDFPCASGCAGVHCSTSYSIVTVTGCAEDGTGSGTTSPPTESTATSQPSATTSTRSVVEVNAAGRARVPFRLW
ncbi:hypothetical protein VTJ83DRAFT_6209 [Remersonia thermophila]|uniref:Uncharacterized protein n=1 Tax=Remersonia thermophila TaxID=72144 RepID=A0ABR4D6B9_9PEZI